MLFLANRIASSYSARLAGSSGPPLEAVVDVVVAGFVPPGGTSFLSDDDDDDDDDDVFDVFHR